jgi:hypothetical protein
MPVNLTYPNLFPNLFYFLPPKPYIFKFPIQSIIKTGSLKIPRTLSREIHNPKPPTPNPHKKMRYTLNI